VVSEWVLFVDADLRLQPATLRRALAQATMDGADLLSLAPRLSCGCLAEWLVQPIMASLLGLGFPIEAANDPASAVAFAAGPFMLFRRSAYLAIGGHRALAAEVVEDLALARRIKQGGHRLRYLLALDGLELRMYSDFASLWEGWTKNWLLGAGRPCPWPGGHWPAAGPAPLDPPPVPAADQLLVADGSRWPGGGRDRPGVGVAHPQRPRLDLERAAVGLIGGAESCSGEGGAPRLVAS